ncbi:MAG: SDR family NAD(P)-dependent oxidoreductase [Thermodesulfobacteriota bacterium]
MQKKILLVVGASRGIGAEIIRHFADRGYRVLAVSRSSVVAGEWIQADVFSAVRIRKSGIST